MEFTVDTNQIAQLGVLANTASALLAFFTTIIAFLALRQWRKQYEENKFLRFYDALIEYNNCLIRAPKVLAEASTTHHRKCLSVAASEINMRWLICLNTKRGRKNKKLIKKMENFHTMHKAFLNGKTTKLEASLQQIITIALHAK